MVTVNDSTTKDNLVKGTYYEVKISITITGGEFGTFSSTTDLDNAVANFNGTFKFTLSAALNNTSA